MRANNKKEATQKKPNIQNLKKKKIQKTKHAERIRTNQN